MRKLRIVSALAALLALAGCVSRAPLALPPDHPANPAAPAGFAAPLTALDDYKSPADFGARAAADAAAPSSHAGHGARR